jgi:uncharacterized protein YutE (UPF0331/DUF86 family)
VTPAGVRLKLVRERLAMVHDLLAALRTLPQGSEEEFLADLRNPAAAESLVRRALEALFDIARHLLAKGKGRGSLEYKEVARLTGHYGLITDPALAAKLEEMAGFRNRLVHFYDEVTPRELFAVVTSELGDIEAVAEALRSAAAALATASADTES